MKKIKTKLTGNQIFIIIIGSIVATGLIGILLFILINTISTLQSGLMPSL